MFSREVVLHDITRFAEAMPMMYEIDSCEVYESPHDTLAEIDLGYRITKDGVAAIIASTYVVDEEGNLEQKRIQTPMMILSHDEPMQFRSIGDCMEYLQIFRK